jgi:hypothetical protein
MGCLDDIYLLYLLGAIHGTVDRPFLFVRKLLFKIAISNPKYQIAPS